MHPQVVTFTFGLALGLALSFFFFQKIIKAQKERIKEKNDQILRLEEESLPFIEQTIKTGISESTRDNLEKILVALNQESVKRHSEVYHLLQETFKTTENLFDQTQKWQGLFFNNHTRGLFGEEVILKMITGIGFIEGIHFEKQTTLKNGKRPDFMFYLPKGKKLIVDCKFPFNNYYKVWEEKLGKSSPSYKQFIKDIKAHMKEMKKRAYESELESLDFVCLLLPSDSVFSFIQQEGPELFQEALSNRILFCSPVLLFPLLSVVKNTIDSIQLTKGHDESLKLFKVFKEEWKYFLKDWDLLEKSFGKSELILQKIKRNRLQEFDSLLNKKDRIIQFSENNQ
jgi:DNA recombination protein RmuC